MMLSHNNVLGLVVLDKKTRRFVLLDFLLTVMAAPHECVIRTSRP